MRPISTVLANLSSSPWVAAERGCSPWVRLWGDRFGAWEGPRGRMARYGFAHDRGSLRVILTCQCL
jgi:hypothetical protein